MRKLNVLLLILMILSSCNDGLDGSSVTNGQMEVSILRPYIDGTSLGSDTTIAGDCGIPNYPIELKGDVSVYTVCQSDNTWSAAISGDGFSIGQTVNVTAALRNPDYTASSPIITRTFTKADLACDDQNNFTKVFANIDTADGDSTPYVICTASQLANINLYPDKNYVIGKNIDFGFARFNPIVRPFTGVLNGQDFVLKNLNIDAAADSAVGLFKVISAATVTNLKIADANVTGNIRVGILAGDWRGAGTIQNVDVTGTVNAVQMGGGLIGLGNSSSALNISYVNMDVTVNSNDYAGGLISYVFADNTPLNISHSNIYANVTGNKYVGGIVGRIWLANASLDNVAHKGDINSVDQYVGGLIGEAYHGVSISNSKHVGSISVPRNSTNQDTNVGGLIGVTRGTTTISDSHVVSNITMGGDYAGGLVGRFFGGSITNSYTRGTLTAIDDYYNSVNKFVGGIAGNVNTDSTFNNIASHMTINSSAEYAGGLIGFLGGAASTIDNSYSIGSITGRKNFIGGLVGQFLGASLTNSFSKANVNITSPTPLAYVGGLVGYVNNTAIFDTLNYNGDILASGGTADYLGGAFGYAKAGSINKIYTAGSINGGRSNLGGIAGYLRTSVDSVMSSMDITGSLKNLGGIAGISLNENISNAFFTGSITGEGNIGGIAGWFIPSATTISDSYSTGALYKTPGSTSTNSTFGPIAGDVSAVDVNNSYFNSLIFDQGVGSNINDHNGFGESKTLSELNIQSTYVGFDFTTLWQMPNPGFTLPAEAMAYEKPIFIWMASANYGFQTEQSFSDDPINEANPNIIPGVVISDSLALEFGESHINEITSVSAPANVTVGNLEITIEKPVANGEQISGRMLVYGECGIAKNTIEISGDFSLRTICQDNNRWAAVIDSDSLPSGNLTLSVDLKNDSLGSGSPIVSKTLFKGSSLCDQSIANTNTYGNTHLGANGSSTPYVICNKGQFANISINPGANYELGRDIDFSGGTTDPIAVDFTGSLDGKNFKIKNFTIDKPSTVGVGLFKSVFNGTIENVDFVNFNVNGYSQVGAIAGSWKGAGTLSNVEASGVVSGIQYNGGLIGIANTNSALNILGLTTSINITGNDYTGGVIGSINTNTGSFTASNLTLNNNVISSGATGFVGGFVGEIKEPNVNITNISQNNNISSYGINIGGLIGSMMGGSISNCNVQGNITILKDGTDGFIGGIIGKSTDNTTINTCSYSGTIHAGSDHVAGIIGYMKHGSIIGSSSSGQIDINDEQYNVPRQFIAGILGKTEEEFDTTLNNLSSSMNINAKASSVGGLIGHIYGFGSTLRNSYATGAVTGEVQFVGGLGGFFMGDILEDSHATGSVTVNSPTPFAYVGGLLGYSNSQSASHKRLYATGNISVNGGSADYVGGLIGFFRAGSLEDSYAEGNLSGDALRNSNGGLIGIMRGDLVRSYALGDVNCPKGGNCGGLIGYLLNSSATYSFANGDVNSIRSAGGLIGYVNNNNGEVVENNYATGIVTRTSGSWDINHFGPLFGEELNPLSVSTTHNYFFNESKDVNHNSLGSGISQAGANLSGTYPNFIFSDPAVDWMMPPNGFEITSGVTYEYPIPDWKGGGGGGTTLFSVGGTLTGLQYDTIRVELNGSEEITLNPGETTFNFSTQIPEGDVYTVIVSKHPNAPNIVCNISNNSGTAVANVSNISVVCPEFTSIDLVALNSMATGASQSLTVNGTLSNSNVVDITSYASFSQNPVNTFNITGNTLTANSDATATVMASFLSLSSSEMITSVSGPSALRIIGSISNAQANQTLSSLSVEVIDGNGQRVTNATHSITLSLQSNPSSAVLSGTLTKSAVNGVITFDDLSLDKIGSGYTLEAATTGLTSDFSNSFDISAGVKASLAYVSQPVGASANTAMSSFSVEVLDAGGNRVTSVETVTLSFGNDPSSGVGSLSGTLSRQTVNGVANFNDIVIDFATSGYTLTASVSGIPNTVSNSFNIYAVATKLILVSAPTNTSENAIMNSFQVALSDDFNNIISSSSAAITLSFNNDPSGSASLGGNLIKNAVNGVVTFNDITIDRAANGFSFIANSSGVSSVVTSDFNVLITAPTNVTLIGSSPSNNPTPTIQVDGLNPTDTVYLYTNSSCSGASIASISANASTMNIVTSALSEGVYEIYARRLNSSSLLSGCSTSFVSYEVQGVFEQNDNMSVFGNWTNIGGDNRDWSLNTGNTPSAGVGPTSESYVYTEASNPVAANEIFYLQSNILDGSSNNLKFDFKWNKRGDNMGDLYLEASNDGGSTWTDIWSHLGVDVATDGADVWRDQIIDLCSLSYTSSNVQLRFRAQMPSGGNVWNSDIALDDLNFSAAGCTAQASIISFINPNISTEINVSNQSQFTIGGSCSDNDEDVIISGAVSATTTCSGNTWSTDLNLSSIADGIVSLTATHIASSGGLNGSETRDFIKDATDLQSDSFDTLGNWINATSDDQDWIINTGGTPSNGVGPTGGIGSSSYIYTEASNPVAANDEFILESNVLDGSTHNLRIEFNWNKRGDNMGNLYLEASTDGGATWTTTLWSHLGSDIATNGISTWRAESIDICGVGITSSNTKLRFRAQMPANGSVWNSDIALDEVQFKTNGCATGTPAEIAITYPNTASIISAANQNAFEIGGTCSDHGQNITFSGSVNGSTTCNLGNWNYTFDLTSLADGNVAIIADHISANGGPTGRDTLSLVKDASSTTIQIDEFNSFINWNNVAYDDRDWILNSGDTASNGVGPTDDFSGGGSYVYTEASNPVQAGDEFVIESNTFDASTISLAIDFKWNKRGDTMGDLYLEYSINDGANWNNVWSHTGVDVPRNGGDIWREESIDLCSLGVNNTNTKFRFRAQMPSSGTIWNSDIALDHIEFKNTGCN